MENSMSGPKTVMLTAAWGGALFGVLQLYRLPDAAGHSICGPWGCGPPIQALAACHGFWLVLFSLPTGLLCRRLDPRTLRRTGLLLVAGGILGLAGIAVWEGIHWWPRASEFQRHYIVQRYLFVVATLVDVPVVEIVIVGFTCFGTARLRDRRGAQTPNALEQSPSARGNGETPESLLTSPPHQPAKIAEPVGPLSRSDV